MLGEVQHRFRKIDTIIIQSTNKLDKERGGNLTTSHTKWQHRGQRGVETEKIDFQVFSWKCLDFEESPTVPDKRVFVQQL